MMKKQKLTSEKNVTVKDKIYFMFNLLILLFIYQRNARFISCWFYNSYNYKS